MTLRYYYLYFRLWYAGKRYGTDSDKRWRRVFIFVDYALRDEKEESDA